MKNPVVNNLRFGLSRWLQLGCCFLVGLMVQSMGCSAQESTVQLDVSTDVGDLEGQLEEIPVAETSSVEISVQEKIPTSAGVPQEGVPAVAKQEAEPAGVLEKAGDLFDQAKEKTGKTAKDASGWVKDKFSDAAESTGDAAKGASGWVQDKIGGAAEATGETAEETMKWASDTFKSLKEKGLTTASDTSEWLTQDWKNMQSWEYKVINIEETDNEALTAKLNELGKEGWDCLHISGSKHYFKKPADSYLRHLPFNDFIKLVPLIHKASQ